MSWHSSFLNVFTRVNNRKRTYNYRDALAAGYPMVEHDMRSCNWADLHKACQAIFKDGRGRSTYTWFGHRFFFLNQEDADTFKALPYLL